MTKTKEGEKLFKELSNPTKVAEAYIKHQKEKGEFAIRITAFMLDHEAYINNTPIQSSNPALDKWKQQHGA